MYVFIHKTHVKMATATQSIRFIGPTPSTGAGNLDALNTVLADLCTRGSTKVKRLLFILIIVVARGTCGIRVWSGL